MGRGRADSRRPPQNPALRRRVDMGGCDRQPRVEAAVQAYLQGGGPLPGFLDAILSTMPISPPVLLDEVELWPCDRERDGELIRALTRANFYDAMKATWNEARHQQEPLHPERYQIVKRHDDAIGFLAIRDEPEVLYLQTIQLTPPARHRGIGTRLMHHVHQLASHKEMRAVQLRVLRSNDGARRLYQRLGYLVIGADDLSLLLERALGDL